MTSISKCANSEKPRFMNATNYFDQSAANWDKEPRRIEHVKAVGEAILRETKPTKDMDVLDYGCGTGLLGLFLLPHVKSVTGADSSSGMQDVLRTKIRQGNISGMTAIQLDLEKESLSQRRFHMIVSSMVMHHVADLERVASAFYEMLLPGGALCIADLDSEPGVFHAKDVAAGVHHCGFDRRAFQNRLEASGFVDVSVSTACFIRKPASDGETRDFPVFLMVGRR